MNLDVQIQHVLALHFDPESGSRYWLERAKALGFDPRMRIRRIEDLALLGPMDADALATRPVEDFIPFKLQQKREELIVAETGGSLGRPKFAVHGSSEFQTAFVTPFVAASRRAGFPREFNWLFIGPTGPHIIGKAARACASAMGSADPFSVDFDPRWAKKLPDNSFARGRYLKHIEEQALNVLNAQEIGVLFATPPVLASLARQITEQKRRQIRGIHFGGLPVPKNLRAELGTLFPNAVMLSGYGNTLFGMAPELWYSPESGIDYYPYGSRSIYRIVPQNEQQDAERIRQTVEYGQRGQVVVHRLDETQLIVNMIERDSAIRIAPIKDAAADGFVLDGLRDPQPIIDAATKPVLGLY